MVQAASDATTAQLDSPQEWNLSDLYQGFDDPRLVEDLASLEHQAVAFRQTYRGKVSELAPEAIAACLQELEAIGQTSGYLYAFPALVFSADTRNAEAKQMQDKVLEAITGIENQLLFFDLELKKLDDAKFR
ncbi:MAG: oligoendopeptidase F, partial [Verrucomicrobia bacterium]|nr:oligoendopeptidase F [Leptolyngbya sp. ES-bin-22]